MALARIIAIGSIVVLAGVVNATEPALIKKQPTNVKIRHLMSQIESSGVPAPLTIAGERHGLKPKTPIKYLKVSMDGGSDRNVRWCDAIPQSANTDEDAGPSLLLINRRTDGVDVVHRSYHFGLDGTLLSASGSRAKNTPEGEPIKGSLEVIAVDATKPNVIASANEELNFWTSGKYRKFMQVRPTGASAANLKPAPPSAAAPNY